MWGPELLQNSLLSTEPTLEQSWYPDIHSAGANLKHSGKDCFTKASLDLIHSIFQAGLELKETSLLPFPECLDYKGVCHQHPA